MKGLSILVLSLSVLFVACSKKTANTDKVQEAIVGRWWSMAGSQKITNEFAKDGTYKTIVGGQTTAGTYRWLDDTSIELNKTQKVKVTVFRDELTMVIGNETSKFERVKADQTSGGEASPASGSASSGIIKQAVLAKHITRLTSSPFDVTDKFPTDQGSIWAVVTVSNAPSGTKLKAVLTDINASDASNPIPPNTKLGENESTANEHSHNVGFNWTYSKTPVGTYKVDIYLNGNLDRTLNFSVTKDAPGSSDSAPKPAAIGGCPKLAPSKEMPPGFPMGVAIAPGVDGKGNPVNPARVFPPNTGALYSVLVAESIPANTKVAIRWFATDTGGLEACNTQFSSNQVVATGSGNPWFSTAPPVAGTKWPEGLYRVEMEVNGNLAMVVDFGVCDGPCRFQVPIAWTLG